MLIIKVLNYLIFQSGWFIGVYYHNSIAALVCCIFAALNFVILGRTSFKLLSIAILITSIGIINDSLLIYYGIITSPASGTPFPLWLAAIWLLFVSTFDGCLAWLKNCKLLTLAVLGAIGGSASYCAGAAFGAITYTLAEIPQFVIFALNWFILFPVLYKLHLRLVSA